MKEQFIEVRFLKICRMVATGVAVLSFAHNTEIAHAEGSRNFGNGAWGINRVIRTTGGFRAVAGTATIDFYMPAEQDGNAWTTTRRTNPYDNKPSAYLGASGTHTSGATLEVDAGLQYETHDWRDYSEFGATEGWASFISSARGTETAVYTNPKVWVTSPTNPQEGQWRPWRGAMQGNTEATVGRSNINSDLRFDIMPNGAARIHVQALGRLTNEQNTDGLSAFFWSDEVRTLNATDRDNGFLIWPWTGTSLFNTSANALSQTSVKRVSAMTRANQGNTSGAAPGNDELDGSEMSVTFSGCQVMPSSGNTLGTWTGPMVNQDRTGYDAQGDLADPNTFNHQAYDRRSPWSPLAGTLVPFASRTVVTFGTNDTLGNSPSAIAARNYNTGMRADSTNASTNNSTSNVFSPERYAGETTRIYLSTTTRPIGENLQNGPTP